MLMEGPLSKWTNVMQGWQYRWFVLDELHGVLSYYTSKEKMLKGVRRGCVRLKGAIIGIESMDDSTFTVKVDQKTFHFQARDADEREQWTRALEYVIRLQSVPNKEVAQRYRPNIPEFEKRLMEADAYLQILLEQSKNLKNKMEHLNGAARAKLAAVLSSTDQMADCVKHSLVILQIAKNECLNPSMSASDHNTVLTAAMDAADGSKGEELDAGFYPSKFSLNEKESPVIQPRSPDSEDLRQSSFPWTSYSSDDEFYDAES